MESQTQKALQKENIGLMEGGSIAVVKVPEQIRKTGFC